ncbi:hypothetical protein T484DRAFT_1841770, partial [Baffinella frigidus]
MAPPAGLLVATCCLMVALLGLTGVAPELKKELDATWAELAARAREGIGNAFKTASLGELRVSPTYQVWLCEEGHACANGTSSYFCFVYDEVLKIFVPWGPNSLLRI